MWVVGTTTTAMIGVLLVAVTGGGAPWVPPSAVSAGWVAAVLASRERYWAPTAAVAGALNMWALFLLVSQGLTPATSVLAAGAIAANAVHVLRMQLHGNA